MIQIGVIGYGYWGPNLARNFNEVAGSRLAAIADLRPARRTLAATRYPSIKCTADYRELLDDPAIDAVAISTPVASHFALTMDALAAGKHVLVEKPLAATVLEALALVDEARRRSLMLMVDHTFVYTPAVQKLRELIAANELGDIYYYDSVRINLGLFQSDVDVIWDLAVHDLSILDYVMRATPTAVSATGFAHIAGGPQNIAYLTLFFERPLIAHIHVNWLAPVKIRRTIFGGSRRMVVYDDLESSEKIKVYDRGVSVARDDVYDVLVSYRMGDMWAPHLATTEALHTEIQHFVDCIRHHKTPMTDGEAGLRIVRILEAATKSMHAQGRPIELAADATGRSVRGELA